MLPDDLQAMQLLLDGISSLIAQKGPNLFRLDLDKLKIEIIHSIFMLAKKRHHQLKLSIQNPESQSQFSKFYKLGIEERAVVYLKDKRNFSLKSIEQITELTSAEIIYKLHTTRKQFSQENVL